MGERTLPGDGVSETVGDGAGRAGPAPSAATWLDAEPEPTPAPTTLQTLRAALRLTAFGLFTLLLVIPFFVARALGRERVVARWWCALSLRGLGLRLRVDGAPMRSGGALLANHASWLDILVIGALAPAHFVAKAEVADWPLFGWIGKISNTVFIARRRAEARAQEALLADRAAQGHLLCLFPEGTSTDGLRVLPFKSALMRAFMGADGRPPTPVQPVSIFLRAPDGLPRSFYGWWGVRGFHEHIWTVAALSAGGEAAVRFHPPLDPNAFADRKALAKAAQAAVAHGRLEAERGSQAERDLA